MTIAHISSSFGWPHAPLASVGCAGWLWQKLRKLFPWTVGVVLMPDGLQLLTHVERPELAGRRVSRLMGTACRRFEIPVQHETRVTCIEPDSVARVDRAIVLEPCRRGLVAHPLSWPWSSARDLVGAVVDPWVSEAFHRRAARRLGPVWLEWVCEHPWVRSRAPWVPVAPLTEPMETASLDVLAQAACAAFRGAPRMLGRRGPQRSLFVALAAEQGAEPSSLAELCGTTRRGMELALQRQIPAQWRLAGRRCVSDRRLYGAMSMMENSSRVDVLSPTAKFEPALAHRQHSELRGIGGGGFFASTSISVFRAPPARPLARRSAVPGSSS